MMIKTAVTLSEETIGRLEYLGGTKGNRSKVIEIAVAKMAREKQQAELAARELALLNRIADNEHAETLDILNFTTDPFSGQD